MKIVYIFLLIISFFFYILYIGKFSFYLFAFLIAMPILLFGINIYLARKINVSFCGKKSVSGKDEYIPVKIKINNPTIFPVSNLIIMLEYKNSYSEKNEFLKINTPVFPKNSQILTLNMAAGHYGYINVKIKKCKVCDILGISKLSLKNKTDINDQCSFGIYPAPIELNSNISSYSNIDDTDSDVFSKYRPGDDPSEIFDIREYKPGDRISRIHWKLSARQNKTMIKDYSLPISCRIQIILNLKFDLYDEDFLEYYDAFLETVQSISYYLAENEITFKILWYDEQKHNNISLSISDAEKQSAIIPMLINTSFYEKNDLSIINFINENPSKCSHLIYISNNYNDKLNEVINENNLADRYTYLVIGEKKNTDNDFADVVFVMPQNISDSLNDIYL